MPTILLLIGPKGAGKSFIGALLEKKLNFKFLYIEKIFINNNKQEPKLEGNALTERGYQSVLSEISSLAKTHKMICIECTGAADYFPTFMNNLQQEYHVLKIKIHSDFNICLKRIRERDSSVHLSVTDEIIEKVYQRYLALDMPWDLVLDNSKPLNEDAIIRVFSNLLSKFENFGVSPQPQLVENSLVDDDKTRINFLSRHEVVEATSALSQEIPSHSAASGIAATTVSVASFSASSSCTSSLSSSSTSSFLATNSLFSHTAASTPAQVVESNSNHGASSSAEPATAPGLPYGQVHQPITSTKIFGI